MTNPCSTRWDVYRDENGDAVTVDCDYGNYNGPDLAEEQIAAVRHAVDVWADVCIETRSEQAFRAWKIDHFDWRHVNMAKSRLLGRMIHWGLPPHDLPPPNSYAGGWWQVVEDGYALLASFEADNSVYDGHIVLAGFRWPVVDATKPLDLLLDLPRRAESEPWRLRRATEEEILAHHGVTTVRPGVTNDEAALSLGPWWWLERVAP